MRLEDFSMNDHELVTALLSDARVMGDLGGALTPEKIAQAGKNYVDAVVEVSCQVLPATSGRVWRRPLSAG
jgi:hypothetical protein